MKSYQYSTHSISRCSYLYPILDVNVETNYIKSNSGFSRINQIVNNLSDSIRIEISELDKHEASMTELKGYFEVEFELKRIWNILVVTDSNKVPLSIIYDDYALNTNEVDKIYLKYILDYKSNSLEIDLNIGTEYVNHMDEYIGTNMQPIPKMLSRTSEYSIVNWSDEDFDMSYDSDVLKDDKLSYDYTLQMNLNDEVTYTQGHQYYLSATTQDMFLFDVDPSDNSAKLYTLNNNSDGPLATFNIPPVSISQIDLVENGYGIVLVSTSGTIYCCKASERRPDFSFDDSNWIELDSLDLTKFSYLIPTFIDLCGCYIKVPDPKSKTPIAYQVRKWTGLFDESSSFGDKIYADTYNYPDTKAPGDYRLELGYWESLGISNPKSYFRSSGIAQDSPVSMHQYDVLSPTEGNCSILDMNLRAAACLYVDLFNNGRLTNKVVVRDCGLEIINQSGGNDFMTYTGNHYKLPEGANITNMCYYINGANDSTIVSLIDGSTQVLDSPILCAKYGVVITRSMLEGPGV